MTTIDRTALMALLIGDSPAANRARKEKLADRILALVQADVSTEPEPGPNMETRARLRDSGASEPEDDDTRDATSRPRLSPTDIHGGGQAHHTAGIDRGALVGLLLDYLRGTTVSALPLAAKILALVQPTDTDGWLVWSPNNVAQLFLDEEHGKARMFAFQVLGTLYRVELVESFA